MGILSKIGKGIKSAFKSSFKRIKKLVKPIGSALKKGLGEVGKFFGKLGPIGTLALTLMLPGLGAAWASFGSWASGLTGALAPVMQGVAAAGNAIGSVYSSVTGMIGDVVGKIAGNTIGKIPVGGGKNLTDVYKGFTQWVGNKMDDVRMRMGLPTSNITPDTAIKDAESLGSADNIKNIEGNFKGSPEIIGDMQVTTERDALLAPSTDFKANLNVSTPEPTVGVSSITEVAGKDPMSQKMLQMNQTDWDKIGIDPFVDRDFTNIELRKIEDYVIPSAEEAGIDTFFSPAKYQVAKPTMKPAAELYDALDESLLRTSGQTTDVIVGFDKSTDTIGKVDITNLKPIYKPVPTATLTPDQIKLNNRLNTYNNYLAQQNSAIYKESLIPSVDPVTGKTKNIVNPEFGDRDLLAMQTKKLATIAGGVSTIAGEPQDMEGIGTSVPYSQLELSTDISTQNDYTKAYGSSYAQAGYQGPNTFEGFASAGFYGADPYSFAEYMAARRPVVSPQPTVVI
jgi:hypothetical protein